MIMPRGYTAHHDSPIALLLGVVGIAFSIFFFLQKFELIQTSFEITDTSYMYFFATFTLVIGTIIVFKVINAQGHLVRR